MTVRNRECDTHEVNGRPCACLGYLAAWRTMPDEGSVDARSQATCSRFHVGHHLARLPYPAHPLSCVWEPCSASRFLCPSSVRLLSVRACPAIITLEHRHAVPT